MYQDEMPPRLTPVTESKVSHSPTNQDSNPEVPYTEADSSVWCQDPIENDWKASKILGVVIQAEGHERMGGHSW